MAHLNGHLLWHKYVESYFTPGKKILEIGPAGYPTYYENVLNNNHINTTYKVLDVSNEFISGAEKNPNFICSHDELNYPIDNDSFDIVFSDQVLAHVKYFWLWYKELIRITKPGGHIITISSYSYPPCPSPIDAWRVHSDGMVQLNNYYNLKTIVCKTESLEMEKYNIPKKVGHYYPGASVKNPFSSSSTKNLF